MPFWRASKAVGRRRLQVWRSSKHALVLCHRWVSLLLGILVVVVSTSGALVVYAPELLRASNAALFRGTPNAQPIGFQQVLDAVARADGGFEPSAIALKDGVYSVNGTGDGGHAYFVDAGSGHVNGHADINGGAVGFLINLHDCALTCKGYAGYLAALDEPSPIARWTPFEGVTWGASLIAVAGLALAVVVVTAPIIWWPGIRRWRRGFRLRWTRGRYARNIDVHNVIGMVAVLPLLMWALTGIDFEVPGFRTLWDAVTGSEPRPADGQEMTASDDPGRAIGVDAAVAAAQRTYPDGRPTFVVLPSEGADFYVIDLLDGGPNLWAHHLTYEANRSVRVDAHDASGTRILHGAPATVSNAVVDDWAQPALHYGVAVNPYWRIIWFVLGLTPLVLMLTGLSTWLQRRSVRRRRLRTCMTEAAQSPPAMRR